MAKSLQLSSTLVEEGAAFAALAAAPTRTGIIVIGGGQAGLSVGYHLRQLGVEDFLILDAEARIGDAWRRRWDSLKLFTPAAFDGLDGMTFPAPRDATPGKDEMADYLEAYAQRFALPVVLKARVTHLGRDGGRFAVTAGGRQYEAARVIVAMSNYQVPKRPDFSAALSPEIVQLDLGSYRNPGQLKPGAALVVGAANSGAEIAKDLVPTHRVLLAGRRVSEVPGKYTSPINRRVVVPLLNRLVFPHILSVNTPIGRKARPKVIKSAAPLIRVKSRDLAAMGVVRVGRITGARDGKPLCDDGSVCEVANVIWCTGFDNGLGWIDLPVLQGDGEPDHDRGVARGVDGLYFVGQHFLTSMASAMVFGVNRDARRIAKLAAG
jgi:putative flavoprotein involved in K+ transport